MRFEIVRYPGWQHYLSGEFSVDALIAEMAGQVEQLIPEGPIRLLGLSMGGHFGYAVAVYLQRKGREIEGLCAIDSFMIATSAPTPGWKKRALAEALELIRKRDLNGIGRFLRSRLWRAFLRFGGNRIPWLLNRTVSVQGGPTIMSVDPILEGELAMRLLTKEVATWLTSLDRDPPVLHAPTLLIRTSRAAGDDAAWARRCPNLRTYDLEGSHHGLFDPENVAALRSAFNAGIKSWGIDSTARVNER
jgi:thioesterase domain-containing protein